MTVFGCRHRVDQGDFAQLLTVGREDDQEIVEARRGEPAEALERLMHGLVRQHIDPPVRPDVDVVMGMRQVGPNDLRVAIQLHQPVAIGGVADALVNCEQVAVRINQGLAEIDVRIGLRPLHRGALGPHGAVRPAPFVQHLAFHADEKGGGLVTGGVERETLLRERRVM
jgi:hypothetical protein